MKRKMTEDLFNRIKEDVNRIVASNGEKTTHEFITGAVNTLLPPEQRVSRATISNIKSSDTFADYIAKQKRYEANKKAKIQLVKEQIQQELQEEMEQNEHLSAEEQNLTVPEFLPDVEYTYSPIDELPEANWVVTNGELHNCIEAVLARMDELLIVKSSDPEKYKDKSVAEALNGLCASVGSLKKNERERAFSMEEALREMNNRNDAQMAEINKQMTEIVGEVNALRVAVMRLCEMWETPTTSAAV